MSKTRIEISSSGKVSSPRLGEVANALHSIAAFDAEKRRQDCPSAPINSTIFLTSYLLNKGLFQNIQRVQGQTYLIYVPMYHHTWIHALE